MNQVLFISVLSQVRGARNSNFFSQIDGNNKMVIKMVIIEIIKLSGFVESNQAFYGFVKCLVRIGHGGVL